MQKVAMIGGGRGGTVAAALAAGRGMAETESGLVVPEHVAEERKAEARARTRILWDEWKAIRRALRWFIANKVTLAMVCDECKEMIRMDERPGGFALVCGCKSREVTR